MLKPSGLFILIEIVATRHTEEFTSRGHILERVRNSLPDNPLGQPTGMGSQQLLLVSAVKERAKNQDLLNW